MYSNCSFIFLCEKFCLWEFFHKQFVTRNLYLLACHSFQIVKLSVLNRRGLSEKCYISQVAVIRNLCPLVVLKSYFTCQSSIGEACQRNIIHVSQAAVIHNLCPLVLSTSYCTCQSSIGEACQRNVIHVSQAAVIHDLSPLALSTSYKFTCQSSVGEACQRNVN